MKMPKKKPGTTPKKEKNGMAPRPPRKTPPKDDKPKKDKPKIYTC